MEYDCLLSLRVWYSESRLLNGSRKSTLSHFLILVAGDKMLYKELGVIMAQTLAVTFP